MTILAHVGSGVFEPLQVIGVTALGGAYAIRAVNLAHDDRPVPGWRMASFYSGLALILIMFVSPAAHIGEELILAHMIQHLVIGDIAAFLIVLGLTRSLIQPIMALKLFERLRFMTLPAVALTLWSVSLLVWHLPALYNGSVTSDSVHALQHMSFIGFGILMWMPVVGPLPTPVWFRAGAAVVYTIIARLVGAGLGNILMWSGTPIYDAYAPGQQYWGIDPITDQGIAGVIMTLEGGVVTLAVLTWGILRWAQQDTERQRLLELAEQHGVELSDERAERAVRSGHAARLEERIRT